MFVLMKQRWSPGSAHPEPVEGRVTRLRPITRAAIVARLWFDGLTMSVFALSLAALTAACATPAPPPAPRQVQPETAAEAQPERGGVLHLPVSGQNASLNPWIASGSVTTLGDTIYEKLIARDAQPGKNWRTDQKLMGSLAERWEQPDQNTYIFSLRRHVTWHDGRPFTAADVLHTFKWLKETKGLLDTARVSNVQSIEAPDDFTIRIVTVRPNPDFLKDDILNVEIAPKHVIDEGKQYETTAIGTGPFKLKQFDKTAGWTVARNEGYWLPDLPYLDGVAGHYMGDRAAMTAALATGKIDVMNVADKPQLESVLAVKPEAVAEKFYGENGYGIFFALDQPPFNDMRVRRAINLALDRQDMIVKGAFGDGVPNPPGAAGWVTGWAIPPEQLLKLPGYDESTRAQSLQQAKQLMAEAGAGTLRAKFSFGADATNARPIAEVGASQLKEALGMELTLVPLDRATLARAEQDESFEMHVLSFSASTGRSGLYERLHSKGAVNKHGPFDPELDALVERYVGEFDQSRAQQYFQQIQRLLYDKSYAVGGIERAIYTVYQPWVRNFMNNYGGNPIPYWSPPITWLDLDQLPVDRRSEKP